MEVKTAKPGSSCWFEPAAQKRGASEDVPIPIPLTEEKAEKERRAAPAVDKGSKNFDHQMKDTDPDPLRQRDDYRRLIEGLPKK